MLLQVLLPRKPISSAAVTVGIGTHERLFGIRVLLVHLTLVPQQTTRVGETLYLVATRFHALVRSIMFVHVLAIGSVSILRCS